MIHEVIVATSASDPTIYVIEPHSGTHLSSYKNNLSGVGGATIIQGRGVNGAPANGYLAASQTGKPAIHFWCFPFGRDTLHLRCSTPEKLGALVATADGVYCVGAGIASGRLYIWEVSTGALVKVWDAHYRPVAALAFTDDGSHLISGGKDSIINVWSLVDLVDEDEEYEGGSCTTNLTPVHAWTDHALPITAVYCSCGGVSGRIYSASMDQT